MSVEFFVFQMIALLAIIIAAFRYGAWIVATVIFAYFARLVLVYAEIYGIITLPWSGSDSVAFHEYAVSMARDYSVTAIFYLKLNDSYNYSRLIAVLYALFEPNEVYPRIVNSLIGVLLLLRVAAASKKYDFNLSPKQLSAISLFPTIVVLSTVGLRESLITFLMFEFAVSLIGLRNKQDLFAFVKSLTIIFFASLFHGALVIFAILLPIALLLGRPYQGGVNVGSKILVMFSFLLFIVFAFTFEVRFAKIGELSNINETVSERAAFVERRGSKGDSGYPEFLTNDSLAPHVLLGRVIYFGLAPMPWDWRGFADVLAFIIGALFAYFFYFAWKNRKRYPEASILLIFLVLFVLAFSFGTTNTGTAIRHKTKILPILMVLFFLLRNFRHASRSPG